MKKGPCEIHGQAADQVLEKIPADVVGNNHDGEEGNQRGEHQAVNEDYEPSLFEDSGSLGLFDFAVDLRQRFLAAHGQHGVTEGDEDGNDAEHMRKTAVRQPAKSAGPKTQITRMRPRRQGGVAQR